jgi:hypothetical protein
MGGQDLLLLSNLAREAERAETRDLYVDRTRTLA